MAVYELRTYTLKVGTMAEAVNLYLRNWLSRTPEGRPP